MVICKGLFPAPFLWIPKTVSFGKTKEMVFEPPVSHPGGIQKGKALLPTQQRLQGHRPCKKSAEDVLGGFFYEINACAISKFPATA
jgi:hypothetical protein